MGELPVTATIPALPVRATGAVLVDRFGRVHRDLRVSLTDRCNLRCTYCMPADGLPWLKRDALLSTPEIVTLVDIATELGIESVRLTGGEPLLRPDVVEVVAGLAALPRPPRMSLTTNGVLLPARARPLVDAGLQRVNVSLDSIDRETFRRITLRDRLDETIAGLEAAARAGLGPIKVNCVVRAGLNDAEPPTMVRWAADRGYEIRFIEAMPLDPQREWRRDSMVTRADVLQTLRDDGFDVEPLADRGSAPAERFAVSGGGLASAILVGIIGSVTAPFCGACDRVRLTADGQWRSCLFAQAETDLREPLRAGAGRDRIAALMVGDVRLKAAGHGIDDPAFVQPVRPMSAIGG